MQRVRLRPFTKEKKSVAQGENEKKGMRVRGERHKRERERVSETERQKDRQTDRQTDRDREEFRNNRWN
jgi:hypothetical protein